MAGRTFNTEKEQQFIGLLMKMPLAERQKELLQCDLNSLAKAMTDYSNPQVEAFALALPRHLRDEFAKTVKMHKGEIPFPKKKIVRRTIQKHHYAQAVVAVAVIIILIFYLDWFMP